MSQYQGTNQDGGGARHGESPSWVTQEERRDRGGAYLLGNLRDRFLEKITTIKMFVLFFGKKKKKKKRE